MAGLKIERLKRENAELKARINEIDENYQIRENHGLQLGPSLTIPSGAQLAWQEMIEEEKENHGS